jgi:hypothetical protein
MIVYIVLIFLFFVVAVIAVFTLRHNKLLVRRRVYYQYNYIPAPLVGLVRVHELKYD